MASEKSRREALWIGLGLVGVAAGWQVWLARPRAFDFEDIEGLPGWRRMVGGEVSTGASGAVFAGLDTEADTPAPPLDPAKLCQVLFGSGRAKGVPVAIFTDVNCPYCRQVAPSLAARDASGTISLHWLEWPIYGAASQTVARALVAAEELGGDADLRGPLYVGAPLPRAVSQSGLAPDRLQTRMASSTVARRLTEIDRAAALLRLPGTPSMVIGRTLVIGALPPSELDRLIELEAGSPPLSCA